MSRSNVSVTVAAASRRMCRLATVKSDLGISGSSQDAKINRLIVAASLALAGPEGLARDPWLQTYLERQPGGDGIYLFPTHYPILSVTSITRGTGASPTTVDASTYSIRGDRRAIYRVNEWTRTGWDNTPRTTGARALDYNLTYVAGWVMPTEISDWQASTAYSAGAWVSEPTGDDEDQPLVFQAAGAGTSDSTEPTWPTAPEGTVVDNDITWTAYPQRFPQELEEAAIITVMDWHRGGLDMPSGIASEGGEGWRIVYRDAAAAAGIPPHASTIFRRYREAVAA